MGRLTSPNDRGSNLAGTDLGAIRGSGSGKPAAAHMRKPIPAYFTFLSQFLSKVCSLPCHCFTFFWHVNLTQLGSWDIVPQVHFGHVAAVSHK
jgi:hypothetical protein